MPGVNVQPGPYGTTVAKYTYRSSKYGNLKFRLVLLDGQKKGVLRCTFPGQDEYPCTYKNCSYLSSLDTFVVDAQRWWKGNLRNPFIYGRRYVDLDNC